MLLLGYVLPQCIGAGSTTFCQNYLDRLGNALLVQVRLCLFPHAEMRYNPFNSQTPIGYQDEMCQEMDDSAGSGE